MYFSKYQTAQWADLFPKGLKQNGPEAVLILPSLAGRGVSAGRLAGAYETAPGTKDPGTSGTLSPLGDPSSQTRNICPNWLAEARPKVSSMVFVEVQEPFFVSIDSRGPVFVT